MIVLYTLPSSGSSRKAKQHLVNTGKSFIVRNMAVNPLSFNELKRILHYTEQGTNDIIANGKYRKILEEEGVDFEDITLREFHHYVRKYPRLLKAPITLGEDHMIIGYDEEEFSKFMPRKERKRVYSQMLEQVRREEDVRLANHERIASGHWG
jgi:regulatory protein spx